MQSYTEKLFFMIIFKYFILQNVYLYKKNIKIIIIKSL